MTIDNEGDTVNESQQTQADQRTKIVAVIGALAEEVDLIARSLEDVRRFHQSGLDVVDGLIPLPTAGQGEEQGRIRLVATVAGMGLVNAAATTQFLIDYGRPEAIIFSGIAGNLTPDLHINDVVLGKTVRYLDSDMKLISESYPALEEFHSDPRLLDLASQVHPRRHRLRQPFHRRRPEGGGREVPDRGQRGRDGRGSRAPHRRQERHPRPHHPGLER